MIYQMLLTQLATTCSPQGLHALCRFLHLKRARELSPALVDVLNEMGLRAPPSGLSLLSLGRFVREAAAGEMSVLACTPMVAGCALGCRLLSWPRYVREAAAYGQVVSASSPCTWWHWRLCAERLVCLDSAAFVRSDGRLCNPRTWWLPAPAPANLSAPVSPLSPGLCWARQAAGPFDDDAEPIS